MHNQLLSLKNQLSSAEGLNRLIILQELCALPAFLGDKEELKFLNESELLVSKSGTLNDKAKSQYQMGKYYLRRGEFETSSCFFEQALLRYGEAANIHGEIDCEVAMSEIDFKRSLNQGAGEKAERALQLAKKNSYQVGLGNAWNMLGWVQSSQGNYLEAIRLYSLAAKVYKNVADAPGIANCYNFIGNAYRNLGKYEQALENHQTGLGKFIETGDRYRIASCFNNMGLAYTDLGKYADAMENQLNALRITMEIDDRPGIAAAYGNLALVHWRQGNYTASLENQLQALKLREEMGLKQGVGNAYLMIGNIHHRQSNYPEALTAYFHSLDICEKIGDKNGAAAAYNNVGSALELQGNNHDALKYYNLSLEVRKELGNLAHVADLYNNIGNIRLKEGHCKLALEVHLKALEINKKLGNKPGIAYSFLNIGNAYNKLVLYDKAEPFLMKALDLAIEIDQKDIIKDSLIALVEVSKKTKDFENALSYYEQYNQIEKELTGQEIKKQLTDLSFKHNIEQKEKEAEIERLRNVELKGALEQLKLEKDRSEQLLGSQLSELKNTALQAQMNPHFVFNSLNAIQRYIWKSNPEKATDYLASFAKLIRLVLENSRQPLVTLDRDLQALDYYIQLEALRFENEFTYQILCDAAIDKEEIKIPPMILQPFVENAIIHGLHPSNKAGKLTIEIKSKDEDTLYISIEDNGIGRIKAEDLNTSTRLVRHHSLGLEVTQQRIEKVKGLKAGKVTITDLYDDQNLSLGTFVEIELPI